MKAIENKNLIVGPGVVLTDRIDPVIAWLDRFFKEANQTAYISRGLTDAEGQLATIRKALIKYGLDKKYPKAMSCRVDETDFDTTIQKSIYAWQLAWSHLLSIGHIINPAFDAVCLMDYYGTDGKGPNRKGKIIRQTPHARGGSFDIGGRGGKDPSIKDELTVIQKAWEDPGKPKEWIYYLPEPKNNCIHNDCK